MKRFYRTVVRVVGVALVIALGLLGADEFWEDIPGLSGCETELCCETCENIPVDRVVDGDTFVSGPFRVRLFGVDAPESRGAVRLRGYGQAAVSARRQRTIRARAQGARRLWPASLLHLHEFGRQHR